MKTANTIGSAFSGPGGPVGRNYICTSSKSNPTIAL